MMTLLCGIPGAGKSTRAKYYREQDITVLSSDELRAEIGGSEENQAVSGQVFRQMLIRAASLLNRELSVVIDATNTTIKARKQFVDLARKFPGVKIRAEVFAIDIDIAKARNKARSRVVPEYVIDRMYQQFQMPTIGEVDEIKIIEN